MPVESSVSESHSKRAGSHYTKSELVQRAERKFELEQAEKRLERIRKRAEPIDPLRSAVLYATLVLSLLILVSSAIFSFATIAAVGAWLMPVWPWLVWLLPVATEFFIVFGSMDTLISQARGDLKGTRTGLIVMLVASCVAVTANAAHTLSEWMLLGGLDWRAWIGVGLSGLIPIATVVAAKRAIALVFDKGYSGA